MVDNNRKEKTLIEWSQLYSFSTGLQVLPPAQVSNSTLLLTGEEQESGYALAVPAPTTLYPTPFPKAQFELAQKLQPLFNELVDKLASDTPFLLEILEPISKLDDFLEKLLTIHYQTSKQERQPIRLGIHRSDYLLNYLPNIVNKAIDGKDVSLVQKEMADKVQLVQVELNTIASSFGSLSSLTTNLHKFLMGRSDNYFGQFPEIGELPDNPAMENIASAIGTAHKEYGVKDAIVLFVVQPRERNVFDQRHIELKLFQSYGIKVVRKSFTELNSEASLDKQKRLTIDGEGEVSVIYFRAGYTPDDYPTSKEWAARLLLEESWAVKCPSIEYHLTGSKKVQQVLAQPGILERYFTKGTDLELLRKCFTGLYPLDQSPEGLAAYELAKANPERYVMKPSREGGGNNLYGEEMLPVLNSPQREAYILMDRIISPPLQDNNVGLRYGQPALRGNFVSELGIYGTFLAHGSDILLNQSGGHLLRSKLNSSNEGGVVVGHSVIDSPFLV